MLIVSSFYLFIFFFTVIGGKNIYLRLSVNGESENKDSLWEAIEKEVPWYSTHYSIIYKGSAFKL